MNKRLHKIRHVALDMDGTIYKGGTLFEATDPFLALLVPLWWAWPSPMMLVVFQVVAVAAGALPVYWLARKHLSSEFAPACFAFAYLLYPATQSNAVGVGDSFHAVSIAIPLILFAIWFLDEERLVLFGVFALLAASTKEEIAASVGCLGLWYAVRRKRWGVGLSIFGLGVTVSLINFLVIIPHFSPSGIDPFAARYSNVGTTPGGILHRAFTDPVALLQAVATGHKVLYVVPFNGWSSCIGSASGSPYTTALDASTTRFAFAAAAASSTLNVPSTMTSWHSRGFSWQRVQRSAA